MAMPLLPIVDSESPNMFDKYLPAMVSELIVPSEVNRFEPAGTGFWSVQAAAKSRYDRKSDDFADTSKATQGASCGEEVGSLPATPLASSHAEVSLALGPASVASSVIVEEISSFLGSESTAVYRYVVKSEKSCPMSSFEEDGSRQHLVVSNVPSPSLASGSALYKVQQTNSRFAITAFEFVAHSGSQVLMLLYDHVDGSPLTVSPQELDSAAVKALDPTSK
jgi:hypothetical protein